MKTFLNNQIEQIYHTGFAAGVPQRVSVAAHEVTRLLLAAGSLQDVGVIGPIERWANLPGRYGLHVEGKWRVTFVWSDERAWELKLERR
jgi:hypothetical protein